MARPKKKGLDYFPLDVYFMEDRKIKPVKRTYGADGVLIYIHILCRIYRDEGYFVYVNEDFYGDMSDDLNMSEEKVMQVVNFLVKRLLFDDTLFNTDKILTSAGIQHRYQEATIKRVVDAGSVKKSFWLLGEDETMEHIFHAFDEVSDEITPVSEEKTIVSDEKSTQSKGKEMKEKKSKQEKRESIYKEDKPPFTPPSYDEVYSYAVKNRFAFTDIEKFYEHYSHKGFTPSWKKTLAKWAKEDEDSYMKKAQREFDEDAEWQSFATTTPGRKFYEKYPDSKYR